MTGRGIATVAVVAAIVVPPIVVLAAAFAAMTPARPRAPRDRWSR